MSKIIWGSIAVVALTAAGATGAKFYADQSLKAYYEQQPIQGSNYSLRYSSFEMGAVSGTANWTLTWQRDPCIAASKYVFTGQDKIKRTWKGYEIESAVQLEKSQDKYAQLIQKPLHANTTINWAGGLKTHLVVPEIKLNENGNQVQLSSVNIDIDARVADQTSVVKQFEMSIPDFSMTDDKGQINFKNIAIKTNQGLNQAALEEGYIQLLVDNIHVVSLDRDATSIQFNQLDLKSDTILHDQTVDIMTVLKTGATRVGSGTQYKNTVFNFGLKRLNRAQVQLFNQLTQQQDSSCAASKTYEKDATKALLAILNAGFEFESLKNHMTTSSGELKADLTGKIMPNYINTPKSLIAMMPSVIDTKLDVEFDKQMISSLANFAGRQDAHPQQIDEMLKAFEQQGKIKLNGNMVKMSVEYKFGQPNFLTPKS